MSWSLALRIVKWSLFMAVFAFAGDPHDVGEPDFTYVCFNDRCYHGVVVSPQDGEPEQNQPEQHYRDTQSGPAPHDESA